MPIARTHAPKRAATDLWIGAGSLLAVGSSGLHYHLWASLGYAHIASVRPLFVVPAVVLVLAVGAGTFRKPLLVAAEAGFAGSPMRGRYVLCPQAEWTILSGRRNSEHDKKTLTL